MHKALSMIGMSTGAPHPPDAPLLAGQRRGPVTWRSILAGLIGVVVICGLTPYNDYAMNNTFLVGNNLPIGVVLLLFLFVLLINAPLHRLAPRWAFSAGEIAVAFSMALVSCTLPSSGLMRYFAGSLVMPYWHAQSNHDYMALLESMHIPRWMIPSFSGKSPSEFAHDPIVSGFYSRWVLDSPYPYLAWLTPALTWGIFLGALYGAMFFMVCIVRRQWFENERLPFPLAQIPQALIEAPEPGHALNATLSRRSFWIAFACIFLLHAWNAMSLYQPRHFPRIPVSFDLSSLCTESPLKFIDYRIQSATIYFTAVGVTYFLTSSVAFSLWSFYVLSQIVRMLQGTQTGDPYNYGQADESFGGIVALLGLMFWVGRHHWKLVVKQAFRGERPGEPRERYMSYRTAFWGLLLCIALMIGWLVVAGASLGGATVMILLLVSLFVAITRIIAETGLVHGQLTVPIFRPFQIAAMAGWTHSVPIQTFYYSGMLQSVHYDFREVLPVYASHALKVDDQTAFDSDESPARQRSVGRRIVACMMLALIVGYFVAFASTLWTEYTYASALDTAATTPINTWGARDNNRQFMLDSTIEYAKSNYHPRHNAIGHWTFGLAFTALLGALRLRYTWWPMHPIGYLMLGTFPGSMLWFSIFLGWLAKNLILRFGGASLYSRAKPFFLGLIVGESIAAGFWLVTGIVLNAMHLTYRAINIMPY